MDWNELFDKVKVTSSNAYDKAKDTTKRLATIADLKSKIRGYNNDKNKLFTQMGMDIYIAKKQGKDISGQTAEFVKKIDTLNVRIKKLEEKLKLVESSESPVEAEEDDIFEEVDFSEENASDCNVIKAIEKDDITADNAQEADA